MTTNRINRSGTWAVVLTLSSAAWPAPAASADTASREQRIRQLMGAPAARTKSIDPHTHENRCVSTAELSIMFDDGATDDGIFGTLDALSDEQLFAAFLPQGSRWTSTATDGAVGEGEALTITYSFVPDGTPISIAGFTGTEASSLFATFDAGFPGGRVVWKAKFAQAFNRWGQLTNITYVEVSDDGATFPTAAGALGSRGDVRIALRTLGEPLAVNFFPQFGGDMVLDSDDIDDFADLDDDFIALRNVLMHEHGHGLGLNHVLPQNGTKLMEPMLNRNFDGPQEDDIRGAQFIYGDNREQNDAPAANSFIGGTLNTPDISGVQAFSVEDVSLERDGASDFYGFTAFAGAPIAILAEPIGTTYEFGAQSANSTLTVNAKAARNLALRLWRRTSAANNTFELFAQIDFNTAGEAEYHPPIRYQVAGFMVAEVFSTDGIDDCQRYRLTISNSDIVPLDDIPDMTVFNFTAAQPVSDGDTVQFGEENVGENGTVTLALVNAGPGDLEIGDISVAGPGAGDYLFSLIGNPVAAGGQGSLAIGFNPSAAGQRLAVMTIPNNDPDQPTFSFILSGTGVIPPAPQIAVEINGVPVQPNGAADLGASEIGSPLAAELKVSNTGNAALNINTINFFGGTPADFAVATTQASIPPGQSATFALTATPSAAGQRTSTLRVFSNAVPSPFLVDLTATGLVPPPVHDCNTNNTEDADDIAGGTSEDCNANGVPDECETDTDGDGLIDGCDACPDDADKSEPGACGCGQADTDGDGNGTADCLDEPPQANGLCGNGAGFPLFFALASLCGAGRRTIRRRA